MDQKTNPPVKPVKPSQLELEPKSREQLLQESAPHIDTNSPAYKADLGKVDAIAVEEAARVAAAKVEDEDFNWNTDDFIILKEQRATAVYFNRMGELIVRQKAGWSDEEDSIVFVMPENFNGFLDGIAARIRQGSD
jgi:hypothetical protein